MENWLYEGGGRGVVLFLLYTLTLIFQLRPMIDETEYGYNYKLDDLIDEIFEWSCPSAHSNESVRQSDAPLAHTKTRTYMCVHPRENCSLCLSGGVVRQELKKGTKKGA